MSTRPSLEPSAARKRSRFGCYTCRIRKVKCESPADTGGDKTSRECVNCQRLGFECRWHPPAAGESYEPPPKRRRAASRRDQPGAVTIARVDAAMLSRGDGDDGASPVSSITSPQHVRREHRGSGVDLFFGADASFSSTLAPDEPSFTLGSTFMDFNLDAEGMDFIPLPMIDPSLLPGFAGSSQTEPLAHWSLVADETPSRDDRDDAAATSPSVNEDNRRLVQHYLDVMKGYSKVDEPSRDASNLFISAFSRSLCFPPLFSAILAFSAAHLSIQDPSYAEQAADLDRAAQQSIESFRRDHELEVEGLLSALFIRVKQFHVMGDNLSSLLALVSEAADIISTEPGQRALQEPSTLARRIILRLAILDARAACYRLGGGVLVDRLRAMPALSEIFRGNRTPETVSSPGPVASLLRANVFRMRVAELDVQLHKQLASETITHPLLKRGDFDALFAEIQHEIELWECRLSSLGLEPYAGVGAEDKALDSASFGCSAVLSVLHSALLYLDHMFPLPGFDRDGATARLLQNQLRLHNDVSRRNSPSSTSPSSLFFAALQTRDPIHRDWVLKILQEAERWGLYVAKTRQLLEAIFRARGRGEKWDVAETMDRVTGRFVI